MDKIVWHKRIIPLVMLAGLFACASSLQLANRFVVEETDIHVLVLHPGQLIKTFLPNHPDSIAADSLVDIDETDIRFVNKVNDSIYISHFMDALSGELERFYVNVYGFNDMDTFFGLDKPGYIFFIAQMELLEYRHVEFFSARDGEITYIRREPVTVLENNVWYEFLKLHDADFGMHVLFNVHATSDYVDGRFIRRRSGDVVFDAERYPLTEGDVIDLAVFSGRQNAQNIFDHLMNLYIEKKLGRKPDMIYQYDVDQHAIRTLEQPGFIRIVPKEEKPPPPEEIENEYDDPINEQ